MCSAVRVDVQAARCDANPLYTPWPYACVQEPNHACVCDARCDENPFYTPWPYVLFCCTLAFSGGSLLILGYAELTCEVPTHTHTCVCTHRIVPHAA